MDTEEELFEFSDEQKIAIEKSREEIDNGNFYKNDIVISKMREMLNNTTKNNIFLTLFWFLFISLY